MAHSDALETQIYKKARKKFLSKIKIKSESNDKILILVSKYLHYVYYSNGTLIKTLFE